MARVKQNTIRLSTIRKTAVETVDEIEKYAAQKTAGKQKKVAPTKTPTRRKPTSPSKRVDSARGPRESA